MSALPSLALEQPPLSLQGLCVWQDVLSVLAQIC